MNISANGLAIIKRHEGLRMHAYPDPASGGEPWTIGYGHTAGVRAGQTITQAEAEAFLLADLAWVERTIDECVTSPLTQGQYDALCSLIFNIGAGAFKGSTLLRELNARDYEAAAAQFSRWNIAAGKVNAGLVNRRRDERDVFMRDTGPLVRVAQPLPDAPLVQLEQADKPRHATPPPIGDTIMPPFLLAALPSLIQAIPRLASLFGTGTEVSDRNVAAVQTVAQLVQDATGATNIQQAVEAIQSDPQALQAATKAVADNWFALTETGGGIEAARAADAAFVAKAAPIWHSPSFIVAALLIPLVYMVVGAVVGLFGTPFSEDVRAAIANGIVGVILGGLIGYYYGQSTSRNRTPAASGAQGGAE